MAMKRRHTDQDSTPQHEPAQPATTLANMPDTTLAIILGQHEKGQFSKITDTKVFTLRDMSVESFKRGDLLRHGTAYELVYFLARLQVATASRMAQQHAELQVIERALDNEPTSDDEPKLQKVGRKCALKKRRTHIELPELNTALVETYKEVKIYLRLIRICSPTKPELASTLFSLPTPYVFS